MTLTAEEVRHYLCDERMTSAELAKKIGMHPVSFRQRCKALGFPSSRIGWLKKTELTEANLRKLYYEDELPQREIAARYEVEDSVIANLFRKFGIEKRDVYKSERHRQKQREKALAQKNFCRRKVPNDRGEYECTICREYLPEDAFPYRGNGLWRCLDCNRRTAREYARNNKERMRVETASRAAAEFGVVDTLTLNEWLAIRAEFDDRCFYCGEPFEHIEHIVPMSQGGPNSKGNVVTSCRRCNYAKKAARTDLLEALAQIRRVQTGDEDFELIDISERDFGEAAAGYADELVSGVIARISLAATA